MFARPSGVCILSGYNDNNGSHYDHFRQYVCNILRCVGENIGYNSDMRVLLVEPDYKSKFPPLGLLKIGTFHRERGDEVVLVRGCVKENQHWDRVYITTLFSFNHKKIIDTIQYYKTLLHNDINRIVVGGGYATLYPQKIFQETGIFPVIGLLDKPNQSGFGNVCVDSLVPDYQLLDSLDYNYGLNDCYFAYTTRGCIRQCPFCAVPKLEPEYVDYTGIKQHIETVRERFGERTNLILMDNNVLVSRELKHIISNLVELGFHNGAKLNHRQRYVDFNQGLDARLITKEKAQLLQKICLRPVRLAYSTNEQSVA
ncbi:MAG: hypothetical protein LBH00_09800 [Planctomycetaceae bacterium]|jgi:hypothetical protein|nr:hypothetical protein [Planctomycetaceae bacterium]